MAGESKSKRLNEVRKDVLGRMVVISASRSARPHDAQKPRVEKAVKAQDCYFCPGNEHLTPPEIDRIEKGGKWEIRCFPNKFPAFSKESRKAYGSHEVVVETPEHARTLSELSVENLADYLEMISRRMEAAYSDPRIKYACVFKNEGQAAGASLEHSHTQVVSMEFVPKVVLRMAKKAEAFRKMPAKQAKNIFAENESFVSLCPNASRFPNEIWIIPKMPINSLAGMSRGEIAKLALALRLSLFALDSQTGYRPYNIIFHSAPKGAGAFPFHLEILPRIAMWAGFELGTEIVMMSSIPNESAKQLREIVQKMP